MRSPRGRNPHQIHASRWCRAREYARLSPRRKMARNPAFKTVQLLKDQTLGIGSYGKVCKAKCDDLLCAAKLVHETLFDPTAQQLIAPQREHRLPMKRFEQECEFLSTIRHPNIIQYLGIYQDSDTGLPALLMELMDESLTHFLESSKQPIPYHVQVNICHDITLALSFLHSNDILHRDLSSNNVLLRGSILAKVSDFGMARLVDQNPRATHLTFTMCPGTEVYMPPEAVRDKPNYTEKIDCFSFGVISVQILTRQFPKPGDRRREIEINHPGLPTGTFEMVVSEIERRQNHISEINPNHSLLQIALNCLKDREVDRPSSQQLCERISALKETTEYGESVRTTQERGTPDLEQCRRGERDHELRSLRQQHAQQVQSLQSRIQDCEQALRQKDEVLAAEQEEARQKLEESERVIAQCQRQIADLELQRPATDLTLRSEVQSLQSQIQDCEQALRQKDDALASKQQEARQALEGFGRVKRQLEESEQVIAQCRRRIADLELERPARARAFTLRSKRWSSSQQGRIYITWRRGEKAPNPISTVYNAVADDYALYVRNRKIVYTYIVSSTTWHRLPDSPTSQCPLVIIQNLLTQVGGNLGSGILTNKLFSLTTNGRRWTEKFPPMPTERRGAIALYTEAVLVVAGGQTKGFASEVKRVEVMNTETLEWSTAADLPQPLSNAPGAVCGDQVYILSLSGASKSTYACSMSALIQSCSSSTTAGVWYRVATPPVSRTTCLCVHGRLLTIGGVDSSGEPTAAVYMYNPTTDSWEVISHMATPQGGCIATVLPNDELMVVGGETDGGATDLVEIGTVDLV